MFRHASRGRANAVDHRGRVLVITDYFTTDRQTMVAHVLVKGVTTVCSWIGDAFAWVSPAALTVLAAVPPRLRRG